MTEELNAALIAQGWTQEQIDTFADPEKRPEDFDADKTLAKITETQQKLFRSKFGKEIGEAAVAEAIETYKKGERARINKIVGLGKTRKETDDMDLDELVQEATTHVKTQIESAADAAGASDETIAELNDWKRRFQELSNEHDELKQTTEQTISEAQQKANEEINAFKIELYTNKLRDYKREGEDDRKKREWARESDRTAGHFYIMAQINDRYDIQPDGTIKNKDGSDATNFAGNGFYKTVDEAYEYLFQKMQYGKQSNGSEGDKPARVKVDGLPGSDELTPATRELIERAEKYQERRGALR